jgi:hypothetical protein
MQNEDGEYQLPWHADLETREHIVLYDSQTNNLPLQEQGMKRRMIVQIFFCLF